MTARHKRAARWVGPLLAPFGPERRNPRTGAGEWIAAALAVGLLAPWCFAASGLSPTDMGLVREAEAERVAVVQRVVGSVASIFGKDKKAGGSGVLFDKDGFALTNHHVVAPIGLRGKAGLADGKLYDWQLIGTDPVGDTALIQLQGRADWPAAVLGSARGVQVGQWVMSMGNPFGLAEDYVPTVNLGIVSGVERYQGGGLVYGSCIQVDSAINPGNSGGPLMNIHGEVIGISGRAAFAERGRVNVGVGFAVSAVQIKNFLPDLLATKVAQHGTLDAQFGMRGGQVVCEAINLDSRAARAGLQLGDRLISVNDVKILSSNQLVNLISTMPAGWPVLVEYEHKGRPFELAVRLSALSYAARDFAAPDDPDPESGDGDTPDPQAAETPKDENRAGDAPPQPPRRERKRRAGLPPVVPGSILSMDTNRANAQRIAARWRAGLKERHLEAPMALRWTGEVREHQAVLGEVTIVLCTDGQFMVTDDKSNQTVLHNGAGYFRRTDGGQFEARSAEQSLADLLVLQTAVQASQFNAELWKDFGDLQIDGGDLVNGIRAFRLKIVGDHADPLYLWLSMGDAPVLLRAGFDEDGSVSRPAIAFSQFEEVASIWVPHRRSLIVGVRGLVGREWVLGTAEIVEIPTELEARHD